MLPFLETVQKHANKIETEIKILLKNILKKQTETDEPEAINNDIYFESNIINGTITTDEVSTVIKSLQNNKYMA